MTTLINLITSIENLSNHRQSGVQKTRLDPLEVKFEGFGLVKRKYKFYQGYGVKEAS